MNKSERLYWEWREKYAGYDRYRQAGFRRRVQNWARHVEAGEKEAGYLRWIAADVGVELWFKEGRPAVDLLGIVPVWRVQLVREPGAVMESRLQVRCSQDVVGLMLPYMQTLDREHFVVILLDTKNRVIGVHVASVGTLNWAVASTREALKPALLANATAIIAVHNHPSGDPAPSPEDVAFTRKLVEAGSLLDIEVLDHVIIGERRGASLKELGYMC